MKKLLVIIAANAAIAAAMAQTSTNSGWAISSASFKSLAADKYIHFGNGMELYHNPVTQSDLFTSFENGFNVDIWLSAPFDRWNDNLGTELDVGLGWSGPLEKCGIDSSLSELVLDAGVQYYNEPDLGELGAEDIVYSHIQLSKEFALESQTVNVFGFYRNFTAMPGSSFRGSNLVGLGAGHNFELWKDRLTFSKSLSIVYDFGGFGLDSGFQFQGAAELDWKVGRRFSLILPAVSYYAPLTTRDSRELAAVVYAGFSYQIR